jgi:hypothetical protein
VTMCHIVRDMPHVHVARHVACCMLHTTRRGMRRVARSTPRGMLPLPAVAAHRLVYSRASARQRRSGRRYCKGTGY